MKTLTQAIRFVRLDALTARWREHASFSDDFHAIALWSSIVGYFVRCPYCRSRGADIERGRDGEWLWRCDNCHHARRAWEKKLEEPY